MKAVILAGGFGTRISEESQFKPKPMVEIGGYPILWHIMKYYSFYDVNEFIICCGYMGSFIKDYFLNYYNRNSDITVDLDQNTEKIHSRSPEKWKVTLIDTGLNTMTGGRIKRIYEYIKDDDFFFLTYGDGLIDIDIFNQVEFFRKSNKKALLTAVNAPGRFGAIKINDNLVTSFKEKKDNLNSKVNGGYFILKPSVISLIADDTTIWENEPLEFLANDSELIAYNHDSFWHPMDTMRDLNVLRQLWDAGNAPWKKW